MYLDNADFWTGPMDSIKIIYGLGCVCFLPLSLTPTKCFYLRNTSIWNAMQEFIAYTQVFVYILYIKLGLFITLKK